MFLVKIYVPDSLASTLDVDHLSRLIGQAVADNRWPKTKTGEPWGRVLLVPSVRSEQSHNANELVAEMTRVCDATQADVTKVVALVAGICKAIQEEIGPRHTILMFPADIAGEVSFHTTVIRGANLERAKTGKEAAVVVGQGAPNATTDRHTAG